MQWPTFGKTVTYSSLGKRPHTKFWAQKDWWGEFRILAGGDCNGFVMDELAQATLFLRTPAL